MWDTQIKHHRSVHSHKWRLTASTWSLVGLSLLYWALAGIRSIYRPFWFDEIYTWDVAQLPNIRAMWAALEGGVDQNLPLAHLFVRASQSLFGPGPLATRLPAQLGFWIMMLGVYAFVRRRLPAAYAMAAMIFPLLTYAWYYATEARAYGLLLAFGALALVFWRNAAEKSRRSGFLVGITLMLAAALASHYTAVLLAIPLALGEIVRSFDRRRIDIPMWCAFAAAIPATFMYPVLLAATKGWDVTGLKPSVMSFAGFYAEALKTATAPVLLALFVLLAFRRKQKQPDVSLRAGFPRHELAALIGFAVTPVCFLAGGLLIGGTVYFDRYGILSIIGLSCLFPLLLYRLADGDRRTGIAVALTFAVCWVAGRGMETRKIIRPPQEQIAAGNPVLTDALSDGRPVVALDALVWKQVALYAPQDRLARLYFVFDPETAAQYNGQDLINQLMIRGAQYFPAKGHVESWRDFSRRNQQFLLVADGILSDCLLDTLQRGPWRVTLIRKKGVECLYEVSAVPESQLSWRRTSTEAQEAIAYSSR